MSWFKARRGGKSITPLKDLPHYIQVQEIKERRTGISKGKAARKPDTGTSEGEKTGDLSQETDPKMKQVKQVSLQPRTPS